MIYAVTNQKGGVGKTTTAVNLSACLAEAGADVLLVDLDPQGNATSGVGGDVSSPTASDVLLDGHPAAAAIRPTAIQNLWLLPATPDLAAAAIDLPLREEREFLVARALADVRDRYRFVFIDCAPSLDLLTINALVASDRVIVPVQCEYYALEGLTRLLTTIDGIRARLNPDLRVLGMLMTMFDSRTRVSSEVVAEVRRHFRDLAFATVVPRNVRLAEAPSHGLPGIRYDPLGSGADAYFEAAKEVVARA